jgi:hypothetical protein
MHLEQERVHRSGSSITAWVVNADDGDEEAAQETLEGAIERVTKQARRQKTRR